MAGVLRLEYFAPLVRFGQAPLVRARGLLFLEMVQVQKELSHPSAAQTSASGFRVTGPKTPRGYPKGMQ